MLKKMLTGKATLLIVDDSEFIRKRVFDIIEDSEINVNVLQAKNSDEAVVHFQLSSPDIVILDIRIPGDNGIKTLARMRNLNRDAKIIMLTNYPYEQYRKKCMETGADYFLSKSDDFDKISGICIGIVNSMNQHQE